jgi:hypothetical protein
LCTSYKNLSADDKDLKKEEIYEKRIINKELARKEKQLDKDIAFGNSEIRCAVFE